MSHGFMIQMSVCCISERRALKPSNVYIQNNGSHVVVGDFCLPSVFADLKTHSRPVIGQSFQLYFCLRADNAIFIHRGAKNCTILFLQ